MSLSASDIFWAVTGTLILLLVALVILAVIHLYGIVSVWLGFNGPFGQTAELRCRKCRYDLRGTPDYCPECGRETTRIQATMLRYLIRIDQLDAIAAKRRARGES